MPEAMKYGTESFEVHLPAEQIAAEVEANHVDLPQRTVAEHIRYALDHPIDSAPAAGSLRRLIFPSSWRSWSRPASGMRIC